MTPYSFNDVNLYFSYTFDIWIFFGRIFFYIFRHLTKIFTNEKNARRKHVKEIKGGREQIGDEIYEK